MFNQSKMLDSLNPKKFFYGKEWSKNLEENLAIIFLGFVYKYNSSVTVINSYVHWLHPARVGARAHHTSS